MKLLHGFCCLVLGIVFVTASGQTSLGGKDKEKDKDVKKEKDVTKTDDGKIVGKVKLVNLARNNFTIILATGKERTFLINKSTKFIGPKGGRSIEGLKDDRMAKGYELKIVPTRDGKIAKEVHLPYRSLKTSETKDKK